jgi:methionine-rich copper-binding protein CopC
VIVLDDLTNTPHLSEEAIEKYILGRMAEPEVDALEQHLLLCEFCRDQVQKSEAFVQAFRSVAPHVQSVPPSIWDRIRAVVALHPGPVWTVASALAAIMLVFTLIPTGSRSVQHVDLSTARGTDASAPHARAKTTIDLQIDLSELPAASLYTIELVDANGTVIANYTSEAKSSKLTIPVTKPLAPGQYWVRIYGNSLKTELLREYGLKVD